LGWILAILENKVTGIPGKHYIFDFSLSAFSRPDRFGDVNEMIGNRHTSGFATFFCLVNHIQKNKAISFSPYMFYIKKDIKILNFLGYVIFCSE
jgi:hypothetical protein